MSLPAGGPWLRLAHRLRKRVQAIQAVDDSKLKWVPGEACTAEAPAGGAACVPLLAWLLSWRRCSGRPRPAAVVAWTTDAHLPVWQALEPARPQLLLAVHLLLPHAVERSLLPPHPASPPPRRPAATFRSFPATDKFLIAPALRLAAGLYATWHSTRHFFYRQASRCRGSHPADGRTRRGPLPPGSPSATLMPEPVARPAARRRGRDSMDACQLHDAACPALRPRRRCAGRAALARIAVPGHLHRQPHKRRHRRGAAGGPPASAAAAAARLGVAAAAAAAAAAALPAGSPNGAWPSCDGAAGKTPFVEFLARHYTQVHRMPTMVLQVGARWAPGPPRRAAAWVCVLTDGSATRLLCLPLCASLTAKRTPRRRGRRPLPAC